MLNSFMIQGCGIIWLWYQKILKTLRLIYVMTMTFKNVFVISTVWTWLSEQWNVIYSSNAWHIFRLWDHSGNCPTLEQRLARIPIDCPSLMLAYNQHIGGIELSYMLVHLFKTPTKSGRWYFPLFWYALDLCIYNAWLVYKRDCGLLKK